MRPSASWLANFISFYADSLFNPHWGEIVVFRADNTLAIAMDFQGLDKEQADNVWQPFFDWVARSKQDFTVAEAPKIRAIPVRHWWDADYLRKNFPEIVYSDPRPDAPAAHVWWVGNQVEVGVYVHGYQSAWLPASLLEKEQQKSLVDALFAGSRHWEVTLHFNKGLAGSPAEAIAAARDTATNPAVLSAFALAIIAGGGPPVYPSDSRP